MVNQETSPTPEELIKMDNDFFRAWLSGVKRSYEKDKKIYQFKMNFMDWFIFQAWNRDRENFIKTVYETK